MCQAASDREELTSLLIVGVKCRWWQVLVRATQVEPRAPCLQLCTTVCVGFSLSVSVCVCVCVCARVRACFWGSKRAQLLIRLSAGLRSAHDHCSRVCLQSAPSAAGLKSVCRHTVHETSWAQLALHLPSLIRCSHRWAGSTPTQPSQPYRHSAKKQSPQSIITVCRVQPLSLPVGVSVSDIFHKWGLSVSPKIKFKRTWHDTQFAQYTVTPARTWSDKVEQWRLLRSSVVPPQLLSQLHGTKTTQLHLFPLRCRNQRTAFCLRPTFSDTDRPLLDPGENYFKWSDALNFEFERVTEVRIQTFLPHVRMFEFWILSDSPRGNIFWIVGFQRFVEVMQ